MPLWRSVVGVGPTGGCCGLGWGWCRPTHFWHCLTQALYPTTQPCGRGPPAPAAIAIQSSRASAQASRQGVMSGKNLTEWLAVTDPPFGSETMTCQVCVVPGAPATLSIAAVVAPPGCQT